MKVSLGQQCTISCTQVAVLRNMPYEEIFEIIENREWENEEDFGANLLDLIRRRKRVKRAIIGESISMTTTRIHTLKPRYKGLSINYVRSFLRILDPPSHPCQTKSDLMDPPK